MLLSDPLGSTKAVNEALFQRANTLPELLEALGSQPAWTRTWPDEEGAYNWSPVSLSAESQPATNHFEAYPPVSNEKEKLT